jgi:Family of unknown function (DUF5681)
MTTPDRLRGKGNDSVGYGRPPVNRQFKPGQSGNPHGRTKGRKEISASFTEILNRKIKIRDGNRFRTLSKFEAAIEVILNKALAGDHMAFTKIILVLEKLGGFNLLLPNEPANSSHVEEGRQKIQRLIDEKIRYGIEEGLKRANEQQNCLSDPKSVNRS